MTLYYPNEREQTHRVLRYNKKYKDYFFRLILVSDKIEKVHFGSRKEKPVLERMKDIMKRDLFIGNAKADVLNYSNSQLKNHSVWMICKTNIPDLQPKVIINNMGTFDDSQGMLKMFARRGQCFSTTVFICSLNEVDNIRDIPDISVKRTDDEEGKDELYVFTDGCGNISPELCEQIAEKFNMLYCSAF